MATGFFSGPPRRLYKRYLVTGALLAFVAVGLAALVSPVLVVAVIFFWPSLVGLVLTRLRCPACAAPLLSSEGLIGPRVFASWPTLPKNCPQCGAVVE
jgi:hypothetical protein